MKILAYCILLLNLLACTYTTDARTVQSENEAMKERNIPGNSFQPKQGWQQSGILTTTERSKRVSMQADFQEAKYFTVQFGVNPPAELVNAYDAIAEITWSVEGATVRREVSVGNGVTISAPGQGVRVVVKDRTPSVFGGGAYDYTVTISVSTGTRPAGNLPTLQNIWADGSYVRTINAGAAYTASIPENAGVVSAEIMLGTQGGIGSLPLIALISMEIPGVIVQKSYTISSDNLNGFVQIPPGATGITIINIGVSALQCTLTWGIDG